MRKKLDFLFIVVLVAALTFFSSCGSDEEDGPTTSPIVGLWTYQSADFDVRVNNQSLVNYLVQALELNAVTAAVFETALLTQIEDDELKGSTITFNADGTYSSKAGDGSTSTGTYTLNNNNTQLTVIESGETTVFTVKELSTNKLVIEYSENQIEDLDEDGVNETMSIKFTVSFTK